MAIEDAMQSRQLVGAHPQVMHSATCACGQLAAGRAMGARPIAHLEQRAGQRVAVRDTT